MPASIFFSDDPARGLERSLTIRTGALAMLCGCTAHAALADADRPPPEARLEDGALVTLYAQPTDVGGGNYASLDDGSGPVDCYIPPSKMPQVIYAMRHRLPISLIARYGADHALRAEYLENPPHELINVREAQAILDRVEREAAAALGHDNLRVCEAHGISGCIECSVADPDDTLPGYREEVEWVTRRGGRARRTERARVRVTSDVDGERVDVERTIEVTLERDPFRTPTPAWVSVDDPAERAALMAEASLRLYARNMRHGNRDAAQLAALVGTWARGASPVEIMTRAHTAADEAAKERP